MKAQKVSAIPPFDHWQIFNRQTDVAAAQHALDFSIGAHYFHLDLMQLAYSPLLLDFGDQAGTR